MQIDLSHFAPWASLARGLLVGLATALLLRLNGRIAGISGGLGSLLRSAPGERGWRLAFLLGLLAPLLWFALGRPLQPQIDAGYPALVAAGLLVGVGTRHGSGSTSGHGICGIARLSPRSLVATLCFMAAGFVAVFALRHLFA